MQLSGELFTTTTQVVSAVTYTACLLAAVHRAPWHKLFQGRNSHVLFGALVGILLLWAMQTDMEVGVIYHLSAMTTLTLMVGWAFAILGGSLVVFGIILAGFGEWADFFPSALVEVLIPVTLTWLVLMLARAWLPRHFFIYVFVNAFFAGGISAVASGLVAAALLLAGSEVGYRQLYDNFIIFFPLMLFPEAVLNGWIVTLLVGLRPQWVATFRDEDYLHGK